MFRLSLSLIFCLAWASVCLGAPRYQPQVLASYPHNSAHFTQGLFFYQGALYESTGLYGKSVLARKDPVSGKSLQEVPLGREYFGEGSCVAGGEIFVLTWKEGRAFVFNPDGLEKRSCFNYQGEGWGLTSDGQRLIRSDGSNRLYFYDFSGSLLGSVDVFADGKALTQLNELEYDPLSGLVLANIWYSPLVAAIHPETGNVEYWLDLSSLVPPNLSDGAVPNGLALNPEDGSLWLTGKLWPIMYQIAWPPVP